VRNAACISVDIEREFLRNDAEIWTTTERILSLFETYGIRATFFVTGEIADRSGGLIEALGEHHEVAAHGYRHRNLKALTRAELEREVGLTRRAFDRTGARCRGFRCPYLIVPAKLSEVLAAHAFRYDSSRLASPFSPESLLYPFRKEAVRDLPEIPLQTFSFLRFPLNLSVLRLMGRRGWKRLLPAKVQTFYFHPWELCETKDLEGSPWRTKILVNTGAVAVEILHAFFDILRTRETRFITCDEFVRENQGFGQSGRNIIHSSGRARI